VNRKTVEKWESKKQDNIPNGETLRRIVKTFEKPEINLNWLLDMHVVHVYIINNSVGVNTQ